MIKSVRRQFTNVSCDVVKKHSIVFHLLRTQNDFGEDKRKPMQLTFPITYYELLLMNFSIPKLLNIYFVKQIRD